MDKYDYVTATIEDEKIRLEKIIAYLENENNISELLSYKERYNNVCRYLNAKERYLNILNNINKFKDKLDELNKIKDEYEVDNILLEDTLLKKFHDDTNGRYRNLLYEDIKKEDKEIRNILYLLFEKESSYSLLVKKRNKLLRIVDQNKFPNTYNTLINQNVLIEKQDSILDEIFIAENNIKVEEEKISIIEDSVMTEPILKLLYEFWITNSYDPKKVDKSIVFKDNKSFVSIKNNIPEEKVDVKEEVKNDDNFDDVIFPNLNLPGINEDFLVDINGKDYVKNDK